MPYLVAAYVAVWIILFGYIFAIERRTARLSRELKLLKELVEKEKAR